MMPEKDPVTWGAMQWMAAFLIAMFTGMVRVLKDVAERKSLDKWLVLSRLSGSVVGGMTLGAMVGGLGFPLLLQYVGASWGGIMGLSVFDLIASEIKRRLKP